MSNENNNPQQEKEVTAMRMLIRQLGGSIQLINEHGKLNDYAQCRKEVYEVILNIATELLTHIPVSDGRMNKQQVKYYFDAVDKMEFKMPVSELPKEAEQVAKELVEKFEPMCLKYDGAAKQCATICVDEMVKEFEALLKYPELKNNFFLIDGINDWQQVRNHITNQI